ncbi:hypothetical protein LJ656_08515 [Paraburkholderia sp. MMS20-SJTR3]|uniref:Uncharacterized protein n=1 Tax=Paraburkholderia sejongensis TaxID=2886946 RepID=A0ABS8JRW8_9BURK|nr:hypothetical protein [Paraburkholderia sp. MMS20-SJTR3]MCC8392629.1 hypothetical protein [Paraburkholderia sp. MMS20-SJTR3]
MATPARKGSRVVLFLVLCGLSFICVRPLHYEWSQAETRAWLYTSQALGIRDPEDLYIGVWLTIELLVATAVYLAITNIWRYWLRCRSRA